MKRSIFAATLVALAVIVAGCSGCTVSARDPTNLTQTVLDEKALYAAEAAYFGAATAAEVAVDNGYLTGPRAEQVNKAQSAAYTALLAARAAHRAGNAATYQAKIAAAQDFIGQAWALIPRKKGTVT